jgi:hypothetical protein
LIPEIAERTVRMRTGTAQGLLVPVTAKLSRKFYEKLGDDVANELVEWFNSVDATYRSDLRELNELNFARFDAKVEQRWAHLDAKLEQRVAELRAEMRAGFVAADAKLEQRLAELETRLTRRMFGFWVAQAATTAGLVFGVIKLVG